jgi:hypothetical protein
MRSCLTYCNDFSLIDELNPSLAVKNMISNFGSYVNEATWQILTVAAKINKIDRFLKNAVNSEGKLPGDITHLGGHI